MNELSVHELRNPGNPKFDYTLHWPRHHCLISVFLCEVSVLGFSES